MTLRSHRPHARHPVLGFLLNGILATVFGFAAFREQGDWQPLWIGLAIVFGLAAFVFGFLAIRRPRTTLEITEVGITIEGGLLSGGHLDFAEVSAARIEPDPEAENYRRVVIEGRGGQVLQIDPRFLNPDRDGILPRLRHRLEVHGIELKGRQVDDHPAT